MKRVLTAFAAVSALAIALPAAAQSWAPINARQAMLDARIDIGIRTGQLTADEAGRLRAEYRDIASLETRYRATGGGLEAWERQDLDTRFDRLSNRIRVQRADNDRAGANLPWQSVNLRQAALDRRIDAGVRDGTLSRREAMRLRGEFRDIVRIEARYRATGGLQGWERPDLDRRFDQLSGQIRTERADRDNRADRGYGANAGVRR
jgi:hypothetical protein